MNTRCNSFLFSSLLLTWVLGLSLGCKSTGQGTGESNTGGVQVRFDWEASSASSGDMKAAVKRPNAPAELYHGKFYQITKDTRVETIGALWNPWYPGW